jgi:hypothetical protein
MCYEGLFFFCLFLDFATVAIESRAVVLEVESSVLDGLSLLLLSMHRWYFIMVNT